MKQRLYLLAFLAFAISLTSCNKDDEPTPVPEVVGKWDLDYGVLIRGFSNDPSDFFVNGEKIDPSAPVLRDEGTLLTTIHVMEANNAFVRVDRIFLWAETSAGTWDYAEAPKLKLKADNAEQELTYSVVNGLEQLHFNQVSTDSLGNQTEIQWVFHK